MGLAKKGSPGMGMGMGRGGVGFDFMERFIHVFFLYKNETSTIMEEAFCSAADSVVLPQQNGAEALSEVCFMKLSRMELSRLWLLRARARGTTTSFSSEDCDSVISERSQRLL